MGVAVIDGERLVAMADSLADRLHAGTLDKGGRPYIDHPRWVASNVTDPVAKAAALLHDTIEDTDATAASLIEDGMPDEVVELVVVLTRLPDETYAEMIDRIVSHEDPRAALIKAFDLLNNLDPTRAIPGSERGRLYGRYWQALFRVTARLTSGR